MRFLVRACVCGVILAVLSGPSQAQTRFRGRWQNGFGGGWGGWGDGGRWGHGDLLFSPDSKLLVRYEEHKIILWQLDEKREMATLEHEGWPRQCRFSPDGRSLLVSVTHDGGGIQQNQIVLWDLADRKIVWRFEQNRSCWDMEFSPDGACVVTSTWPLHKGDSPVNKVVVWSTATFDELRRLTIDKPSNRHRPQNTSLDVSADGKLLLTSSHVGTTLWDTATWQPLRVLKSSRDCFGARFSPDGRQVFAACQGDLPKDPLGVCVWDVATGKPTGLTAFDHDQGESCHCWFTLAPDGGALVANTWIWERKTNRHRRHTMRLWDLSSGRETVLQHSTTIDGTYNYWGVAAFSPDGAHFAFAPWQANPEIRLVNTKSSLLEQTFDMAVEEDAQAREGTWDRWVRGARFSPDGRWLVAARHLDRSRDHEVFLWDLESKHVPQRKESDVKN